MVPVVAGAKDTFCCSQASWNGHVEREVPGFLVHARGDGLCEVDGAATPHAEQMSNWRTLGNGFCDVINYYYNGSCLISANSNGMGSQI